MARVSLARLVALAGPIRYLPREADGHFGALVRGIVYQQLAWRVAGGAGQRECRRDQMPAPSLRCPASRGWFGCFGTEDDSFLARRIAATPATGKIKTRFANQPPCTAFSRDHAELEQTPCRGSPTCPLAQPMFAASCIDQVAMPAASLAGSAPVG